MWHRFLKLLSLALLVQSQAQAHLLQLDIPQYSHEATRNVRFVRGEPIWGSFPASNSQVGLLAVETHYGHCLELTDALYCDAPTGTCEQKTCGGEGNPLCKPRMAGRERDVPTHGPECLAYAHAMMHR